MTLLRVTRTWMHQHWPLPLGIVCFQVHRWNLVWLEVGRILRRPAHSAIRGWAPQGPMAPLTLRPISISSELYDQSLLGSLARWQKYFGRVFPLWTWFILQVLCWRISSMVARLEACKRLDTVRYDFHLGLTVLCKNWSSWQEFCIKSGLRLHVRGGQKDHFVIDLMST